MTISDPNQSNILRFDPGRHRFEDPALEQLFGDISQGVKELKRKNQELEERNAELLDALSQANDKLSRLQIAAPSAPDATSTALKSAVQMLGRAEQAAEQRRMAAAQEATKTYEDAVKAALELQKEAASLLEKALSAATGQSQDASGDIAGILRETRESISAMAAVQGEQLYYEHSSKEVASASPIRYVADLDRPIQPDPPAELWPAQIPSSEPPGRVRPPVEQSTFSTGTSPAEIETIELVASPFRSFATLTTFHRAVSQLPGVEHVEAMAFDRGTLRLAVEYGDPVPFAGRLAELAQFNPRFVSIGERSIEVTLDKDHLPSGA